MNQKERNELSRARILVYASAEFAEHGYHGASVNRICENGKISKGLMYHYYKDKDDLYLACVTLCCSRIAELAFRKLEMGSVTVEQCFDSRAAYFEANPVQYYLYLDSITNITPHLQERLLQSRKEYDDVINKMFGAILKNEYPEAVIDIDFAFTMLAIVQRGVNSYIGSQKEKNFGPAEHAALCKQAIGTVVRGLYEKKGYPV